jgi:rubrerythrin
MSATLEASIEALRAAEKEQAMFYRRLAALAEARDDEAMAQRLHDLHADEQHHLSRLTARLVELGRSAIDLSAATSPPGDLDGWEDRARERETNEVARYEAFLAVEMDDTTRHLAESILEVERLHRDRLGGKWTMA